ncbi:sporulation protein [Bacillus sp. WMMC1349]|uniref:sporulation protein n=1 Tax=Bacillus sp. WMMC1349 TaxID=2736254 RepID=UPI001555C751|nr:sporulation protein [Bacillus sp. WMMC1349]NPC91958.1 sporulation protein [Bacillus sp. WMMC1349]
MSIVTTSSSLKITRFLEKKTYYPGEEVNGTIYVEGDKFKKNIQYIDLLIDTHYNIVKETQNNCKSITIDSHRITEALTINPGEDYRFSFSFTLPFDTPVTVGKAEVHLLTDVGTDKFDQDQIVVQPHPWINCILQTIESLGFRLHDADCEQAPYFKRRLPFVQEFEFVPVSPYYRQLLSELELIFLLEEDGFEIVFETNRRARGLRGWMPEIYDDVLRVHFDESELTDQEELTEVLKEIIDHCAK